jgi:hypothetical protein
MGADVQFHAKEHAEQSPGMHDGLVPLRDPADGPVTFIPFQRP